MTIVSPSFSSSTLDEGHTTKSKRLVVDGGMRIPRTIKTSTPPMTLIFLRPLLHIIISKDSPLIVIDEFAGMFFALAFLPKQFGVIIIAFILFRIFDVSKLYPIKLVENKLSGGLGIVADDVIAGLLTNFVLHFLYLLL